jgi:hypothetical protein
MFTLDNVKLVEGRLLFLIKKYSYIVNISAPVQLSGRSDCNNLPFKIPRQKAE